MAVGAKKNFLDRQYPAKVLLFGEHLVLDGASCLAMPFGRYGGHWSNENDKVQESLDELLSYISKLKFLTYSSTSELKIKGYSFLSNIPRGYGLGSSGALCAAIYEYLFPNYIIKGNTTILEELAAIESFFHGKSSGLDAFVSLMNAPVQCYNGSIELIDFDLSLFPKEFYLLDSGVSRSSKSLISKFVKEKKFSSKKKDLIAANNRLIGDINRRELNNIDLYLQSISEIQYDILDYMIVDSIRPIWENSLNSHDYFIKLCGAGGGGYYLIYGDPATIEHLQLDVIKLQ